MVITSLTLVDNYSRECLEIEVGQNLERHRCRGGAGTDQSVARRGTAFSATTGANSSRRRWTSGLMITR